MKAFFKPISARASFQLRIFRNFFRQKNPYNSRTLRPKLISFFSQVAVFMGYLCVYFQCSISHFSSRHNTIKWSHSEWWLLYIKFTLQNSSKYTEVHNVLVRHVICFEFTFCLVSYSRYSYARIISYNIFFFLPYCTAYDRRSFWRGELSSWQIRYFLKSC